MSREKSPLSRHPIDYNPHILEQIADRVLVIMDTAIRKYGSLNKFAKEADIGRSTLARMRTGWCTPRMSTIEKLEEFLGLRSKPWIE